MKLDQTKVNPFSITWKRGLTFDQHITRYSLLIAYRLLNVAASFGNLRYELRIGDKNDKKFWKDSENKS